MNVARFGTSARRALIAAVGLVLLSASAVYADSWTTTGKYVVKEMLPDYKDPQHIRYDPGNNVVYLDDQRRAKYKVEFRADENGNVRAYRNGALLDTSVDGNPKTAIFVMDAEGNFYVIPNKSEPGRIHHSTIPAGQPVAAAGHIMANNGIIGYIDNNSGHYKPENKHLMQAIALLEAKGIPTTYDINFEHHDPVPQRLLDLDPGSEAKLKRGEIFVSEAPEATAPPEVHIFGRDFNDRTTLEDLIAKASADAEKEKLTPDPEGGPNQVKEYPIPIVIDPETGAIGLADRSGEGPNETRLTHEEIADAIGTTFKDSIVGFIQVKQLYDADGKPLGRELILDFVSMPTSMADKAFDPTFWVKMLKNLALHSEGKLLNGAGLTIQSHRELGKLWWRFQAGEAVLVSENPPVRPPAPPDPTPKRYFPKESTSNSTLDDAKAEQKRTEGNVGLDTDAPANPVTPPDPELTEQGPSNPDLETKIRSLLDGYTPAQLKADLAKKDPKFFQNELFRTGDAKERIRSFKRVLSERKYMLSHNEALADLRRELIVSTWEKVARDHSIPIELIDAGRTNGFLSDLDITIYVPPGARGNLTIATLIGYFNEEFKRIAQAEVGNLDVTIHDGDLFIPDPRLSTQSFEEYAQSLNDVLKKLREAGKNQDLYTDPDANRLQVQRRALREGRVTKLTPNANGVLVVRSEAKVADLSWKPGGGWDINSSRFEGSKPTFDRSDIFGNLLENLDHMSQNGEDPALFAKAFMRAINQGVGAGLVNSYSDIHSAPLPERGNAPGGLSPSKDAGLDVSEELVRLALNLESGNPVDRATERLGRVNIGGGETVPTRTMTKLRWIIRAFGLARPAGSYYAGDNRSLRIVMPAKSTFTQSEVLHARDLFRLINVAADMEALKNAKEFKFDDGNPNRGRSSWLRPYLDEAEKVVRQRPGAEQLNDKAMGDAIYAEAWRYYTRDLKDIVVKEMATSIKRFFYDLTPEGLRRNAMYFARPDGTLDLLAARKFAQQRREQLAQLFETIEALDRRGMLGKDPTPEQVANAEQSRLLADSLRANVRSKVAAIKNGELQDQIEKMMDLSGAELGNFLKELGPSDQEIDKILETYEARLRAINEPTDTSKDAEFAEWMRLGIIRHNTPADGPSVIKALDAIDAGLGSMLDTIGNENEAGGKREAGDHFPGIAMMSNSLLNIATAYSSGDPIAFRESVIGEAFFLLLPPTYGVIGTAFKDFGRGKFTEGMYSIGFMAGLHAAESLVPGAGEAVMVFMLARGVPKLAYILASQQMDQDVLEQAFQSVPSRNPDGGLAPRRAERNPDRFLLPKKDDGFIARRDTVRAVMSAVREAAKTDPPLKPILWGFNSCGDPSFAGWPPSSRTSLVDPVDSMSLEERLPLARRYFGAQIKKDLADAGLAPSDVAGNPEQKSYAAAIQQRLEKSYAFDLPFNLRMAKLYDCFFPELQRRRQQDPKLDEDVLLVNIFTEVVDQWFNQQPDPYKEQFEYESMLQKLMPWHDPVQHSARMRKAVLLKLISLYKQSEDRALQKVDREQEVLSTAAKNMTKIRDLSKRAYGMRTTVVNKTGERIEKVIANNYADMKEMEPKAWLSIPPHFVSLGSSLGESTPPPILANVRADATHHPKPWQALYSVTVDSCNADWQTALPGLRLSAAEQKRIDAKSTNANALLGNYHDRVLAVNFAASADIVDASGAKFASTGKTLVRGYVIETITDFSATIKVTATGKGPGGEVKLTPTTLKVNGQPRTFKGDSFTVNAPGSYQIEATFAGGDWGKATTTVTVAPPQEDKALCTNNPKTVEVTANLNSAYVNAPPPPPTNPNTANPKTPDPKTSGANTSNPSSNPGGQTTPPKDPGKNSGTTPGGANAGGQTSTGPDPRVVASCEQLIASAGRQSPPDPATISQIQKQCAGVSPGVDQGLGTLETNLANTINAAMQSCDYEKALTLAQQGSAALTASPTFATWLTDNLSGLQSRAKAETAAKALMAQAQAAILRGDIQAALADLDDALKTPTLPKCLADQINALRGPLAVHQQFINLSQTLLSVYDRCDVNTTINTRNQMELLQPRDQMMSAWIAQNPQASLTDWARRAGNATQLRNQAVVLSRTASTTADWDRVIAMLENARDTSPACIQALGLDQLINEAKLRRPAPATTIPSVNPPVTKPKTGVWKLVSTAAQPQQKRGWDYTAQSTTARVTRDNGDKGEFQWNAPPPEFDAGGFSVFLSVRATPTPRDSEHMLPGAYASESLQLCVGNTANANNCAQTQSTTGAPASGSKTVRFTPDPRPADINFTISVNSNELVFVYRYQYVLQ